MTELETAIRSTLRADAEESAMSTNTHQERRTLEDRLDVVDQHRHATRTRWIAGLAAAAVVVAVVIGLAVLRPSSSAAPAPASSDKPTPTPSGQLYTTTTMTPNFTFVLPGWVVPAQDETTAEGFLSFDQDSCGQDSVCAPSLQYKLHAYTIERFKPVRAAKVVEHPTYAQVLANWDSLQRKGVATVTGRATTTVDGWPAVTMTVVMKKFSPGVLFCLTSTPDVCDSIQLHRAVHLALVDHGTGTPPMLLFESCNADNPDQAAVDAEFHQWLSTVRFLR